MKYLFVVLSIGPLLSPSFAQTTYAVPDTAYVRAVEQAFVYLKKGDCQSCLNAYRKAFAISQKSALSTLRAAVCAHQCGQEEQARTYLQKATALDWWASEDVWENQKEYPEFNPLRVSPLATDFQASVDQQKIAAGRNPTLERDLKQIFEADQKPRLRMDTGGRQYGFKSAQATGLWQEMRRVDSVNLLKIEAILQQYGYPGKQLVGDNQSSTVWLVIQHAPLPIQEKYLPLMQKAAAQGEMQKSNLALLIDRILVSKGQKQIYGSQVHTDATGKPDGFHAIEEEATVNKRRAEMGLPSLEEYAKHWGLDYKPVGK